MDNHLIWLYLRNCHLPRSELQSFVNRSIALRELKDDSREFRFLNEANKRGSHVITRHLPIWDSQPHSNETASRLIRQRAWPEDRPIKGALSQIHISTFFDRHVVLDGVRDMLAPSCLWEGRYQQEALDTSERCSLHRELKASTINGVCHFRPSLATGASGEDNDIAP